MPRKTLFMRLEGPLQSWGSRSCWDVRDTGEEPTKSGVIGLIGCALGYPMYDSRLERLCADLIFGVRTESPGRIIRDFHTVTDYLPNADGSYRYSGVKKSSSISKLRAKDAAPATIVSPRYYLEDASFLVALQERSGVDGLLEKCAEALQKPVWPIYLGRKSCVPTRPVFDGISEDYDTLIDALTMRERIFLGGELHKRRVGKSFTITVEDPDGNVQLQDVIRTNAARQYGYRSARRVLITSGG